MKDRNYIKEGAEQAANMVQRLTAARRAAPEWNNQAEFGQAVGVSGQTVSQTELQNVKPRLELMCSWALALGFRLELVELPAAELGDEPTLDAPCPTCGGQRVVESRNGETSAVVVDGQAFVACPVCVEG